MTALPPDSAVYRHLWSTDEVRALLDDTGRTQRWLDILAALAESQAEHGIVPAAAAAEISQHARVELVDLDLVAAETRATGHSTLGLIRVLREALPPSCAEWVYVGATVQDITDTWFALVWLLRIGGCSRRRRGRELSVQKGAGIDCQVVGSLSNACGHSAGTR